MIRRKPHDLGQRWITTTFHADQWPAPTVTFHDSKELAEAHVDRISSAFDLRYAYISHVEQAFQAGKPGS